MMCLSVSPPYGTLIALLLKKLETRSWLTNYRGKLAIHQTAAPGPKGMTEAALWELCASAPFGACLQAHGYGSTARLPRGKIVAVVELVDCVPTWATWAAIAPYFTATRGDDYWHVPPPEPERSFGDYTPGRYAWLLANVVALPNPVPARGMPGLWRCDAATEAAVRAQLDTARTPVLS